MSNHFTYEINERNLKVQLKNVEIPANDEDWDRLEAYSKLHSSHFSNRSLKQFSFPIPTNIALPAIFGALVLLFSWLLFNFINIKNPEEKSSSSKSEPNATIPTESQLIPTNNLATPIKNSSNPSPELNASQAIKPTITELKGEKKLVKPLSSQNTLGTSLVTKPAATVSTTTALSNITTGSVSTKQGSIKKKQRRETADVVETNNLPEARPAVGDNEREANVPPN